MIENGNGPGARRDTVELTISARPENLALARLALAGVAASAGAPQDVVSDLKVAVTEACTNAIQHAYPRASGDRDIVVRYTVGTRDLSIEVEDFGVGFEPESLARDPDRNGQTRGLGLIIIRELADELTITSKSTGSRIAFAKRFSAAD